MISSMVIVFREMLEMVLVVGVLLVATRGLVRSRLWIGVGAFAGLLGAGFFGIFMEQMEAAFSGDGEFIFNAVILLAASLMIAWTVFWMSRHGREMSGRMHRVADAASAGEVPLTALAVVAMAAVMREGSEAVFFLFGAAQGIASEGAEMLIGGLLGAVVAFGLGTLLYFGLVQIPLKRLFSVVGWLLMLLAAGMASQAAANLVMINMLPALIDPLWNSSALIASDSMAGELLHVLVGYDDEPSAIQVLVFILSLAAMTWFYLRKGGVASGSNEATA